MPDDLQADAGATRSLPGAVLRYDFLAGVCPQPMNVFAHIKRCLELSDRDVASAIADRRMAKALLDQLAKVSRPGDGAPKLLLVFAKMAAAEVDWIDGALRVEMVGEAGVTVVEVLSELGLGMRERVFASFNIWQQEKEQDRAAPGKQVPCHPIDDFQEPLCTAGSRSGFCLVSGSENSEEDATKEMPRTLPETRGSSGQGIEALF